MSIGALARRLGVSPPTIRDWELRYGVTSSARSNGGHRRYTEADVERLLAMRALVLDGIAPSDAARLVLDEVHGRQDLGGDFVLKGPGRGAGGRSLTLPIQTRQGRSLSRAVLALDGSSIRSILDRSLREYGSLATWESLVVPIITSLADRVDANGAGIAYEHLNSAQITAAFDAVTATRTRRRNHRTMLLSCAPHDGHDLALHALGAVLAEHDVGTTFLGAHTPLDALGEAVARLNPSVVFVWSSMPVSLDMVDEMVLPTQRPMPKLFVGGGGWDALPGGASKIESLGGALSTFLDAAGLS